MCARIGDVVSQDKTYTIQMVLKLVSMFKAESSDLGLDMTLKNICACFFLLLTCLVRMKGYAAVWTDLATLQYGIEYCKNMDDYWITAWPIVGCFKAHNRIAGCYTIPIAGTTTSSINFFTWTQWFICRLGTEELTNG